MRCKCSSVCAALTCCLVLSTLSKLFWAFKPDVLISSKNVMHRRKHTHIHIRFIVTTLNVESEIQHDLSFSATLLTMHRMRATCSLPHLLHEKLMHAYFPHSYFAQAWKVFQFESSVQIQWTFEYLDCLSRMNGLKICFGYRPPHNALCALGNQVNSLRPTEPAYSIGKQDRLNYEKVWATPGFVREMNAHLSIHDSKIGGSITTFIGAIMVLSHSLRAIYSPRSVIFSFIQRMLQTVHH